MTTDEAFALVESALRKALNRDVKIELQTDLVRDGVIDSLDGLVFVMELTNLSEKTISDEQIQQPEFFNVQKLCEFLAS